MHYFHIYIFSTRLSKGFTRTQSGMECLNWVQTFAHVHAFYNNQANDQINAVSMPFTVSFGTGELLIFNNIMQF